MFTVTDSQETMLSIEVSLILCQTIAGFSGKLLLSSIDNVFFTLADKRQPNPNLNSTNKEIMANQKKTNSTKKLIILFLTLCILSAW